MLDQSCPAVTANYTGFSITWNETLAGVTAEAPCTGDNLNGKNVIYYMQKCIYPYSYAYIIKLCSLIRNMLQELYGGDA